MGAVRIHVAPKYRPRGMVGLALGLGATGGCVDVFVTSNLMNGSSGSGSFQALIFLVVLLLVLSPVLIGLALALALAFVTQHRGRVLLLGTAYGLGMGVGAELSSMIAGAYDESVFGGGVPHGVVSELIVLGLLGGLAALLVRWSVRLVWFTLVEQDGELCWWCGYRVGPASVPNCDGCGAYVERDRLRMAPLRWLVAGGRRVGWIAFLVFVGTSAAWLGSIWSSRIVPKREQAKQIAALGRPWPGTFWEPGSSPMAPSNPCPGAQIDLGSSLYLMVVRPSKPRTDGIVLQIQLMRLMRESWPGGSEWSYGVPRVVCNLNAGQAAEVDKNGVPQSLKDAIAGASNVSWNGWMGPGALPPDTVIDPAPHFPSK